MIVPPTSEPQLHLNKLKNETPHPTFSLRPFGEWLFLQSLRAPDLCGVGLDQIAGKCKRERNYALHHIQIVDGGKFSLINFQPVINRSPILGEAG